jgi:hypothetical protein
MFTSQGLRHAPSKHAPPSGQTGPSTQASPSSLHTLSWVKLLQILEPGLQSCEMQVPARQ